MEKTRVIYFFEPLEDNRRASGNKQHELLDIVAIAICSVICGADSWEEVQVYGKIKFEWLSSFFMVV